MMIDTHCHLVEDAFDNDVDEVIVRAVANGVRGLMVLTEEKNDIAKALALQERFPEVVNLGFGVHPVQKFRAQNNEPRCVTSKDMEGIHDLIIKHGDSLSCVGEIGLDHTPDVCSSPDQHAAQKAIFVQHIRLARQLNLPVNVHSRSAPMPTIEVLKAEGATKVQLHAFDGRPSQAMLGVQAGFYFSIPPCVVRSKQKQELVKSVPLTSLMLESDAPCLGVLAEVRNEPAEIIKSCEFIAEAKGVDVATVKQITTENALKLYPNLKFKKYY